MNVADATALIDDFQATPKTETQATFMEIAGFPHYENVISNMLAFYFDPEGGHGLNSVVIDALLKALDPDLAGKLANVSIEREVSTEKNNRIDIVVFSDSHILAIENKIFANLTNPLTDYANFIRNIAENRQIITLILGLAKNEPPSTDGFQFISYENLTRNIRSDLGHYARGADARHLIFLTDLLDTIENLGRGTYVNTEWLDFVRKHENDLLAIAKQVRAFRKEMRSKVQGLQELLEVRQDSRVRQWLYREEDYLEDTLVHDFKIAPDLPLAIDTTVSSHGWRVEFFVRQNGDRHRLNDFITHLAIPFTQDSNRERLLYLTKFAYSEPLATLQMHLQPIIQKIEQSGLP